MSSCKNGLPCCAIWLWLAFHHVCNCVKSGIKLTNNALGLDFSIVGVQIGLYTCLKHVVPLQQHEAVINTCFCRIANRTLAAVPAALKNMVPTACTHRQSIHV